IINGLTLRLCAAIGVMIKFLLVGCIMGPPQLSEYPVDPVGVEIINPSAQNEFKNSPFICASTVIILVVSLRVTVISLRAKLSIMFSLLVSTVSKDLLLML